MDRYPDIRDLQILIALSQRKHFTRAAADCGISQPAFSARIRALENQLGVPIVRRGNKFLGFTKDGELLLKWARKILTDAEGLRQEIEVSKGALQGALVLGVVPTALPFAASVSTTLRAQYGELTIQIQSLTSAQIALGLSDYSLDAGITYHDETEIASLRFEPIYEEQYVLLSPMHLAPRKKGSASWVEAASLPLCLLSKDMRFRQIVDHVFERAGVLPAPVMETNAFTAALAQVTNGSAATIAPQKLIDSLFLDQNSISLKLKDPVVTNTIGLAMLHHEPALPAIEALQQVIGIHHK